MPILAVLILSSSSASATTTLAPGANTTAPTLVENGRAVAEATGNIALWTLLAGFMLLMLGLSTLRHALTRSEFVSAGGNILGGLVLLLTAHEAMERRWSNESGGRATVTGLERRL